MISAFSGANVDYVSYHMGEPSSASSIQAAMPPDQQSIDQKIKNVIGVVTLFHMFGSIAKAEGNHLREKYGDQFSGTEVGGDRFLI